MSKRLLKGAGLIPASQGRGPVVLMYHSIIPKGKKPLDRWELSVSNFYSQISLLKSEGWTTACVRDLLEAESLPLRTVVITFDDGYSDNFKNAFRRLAEYGMRATWFIVSKRVDKQSWLSSSQLHEMAAAGMEIGAHTRTHVRLPELNRSEIEDEVIGSKKELEAMLSLPIKSFAYPYGLFNEESVEAVRKAGFQIACTTRTGWFGSAPDILRVRRVAVFSHDSLSSFARKLAFATSEVSWKQMMRYTIGRIKSRFLEG